MINNYEDLANHLDIWPYSVKNGIYTKENLDESRWESRCSRRVYKSTSCGAWLSFVEGGIQVGSIVEGVDEAAIPVTLLFPFTPDEFYKALDNIENQCNAIWLETHGCDKCAELWGMYDPYDGMPLEGYDGITPVHEDCPQCNGHGVVI